ncbi:thiol-disulfide oxidoreductase DCC family protein [Sphingomonas flavescens]|uniref:thiol-disulfide oxidoreductase DCC family protein n=1 Tax=Sphingomonas flavescens TaxID=3132797 RepID=UPI0028038AD7|nr:DCC1-like thiol-disulfide oxidoreductase family protein [Sphingomonas limnosediminicola]
MTEAFSYRDDPKVPDFPDDRPLFVFDGYCVLCSTGVSWLMKYGGDCVRYASAQSPLGAALFDHYRVDPDKTYLLIADGNASGESTGYLRLCRLLGGFWKLFLVFGLIPRPLRDWAYRVVARNRYGWFGKVEQCALLSAEQRARMLG